jgi:hypothetical protein
MKKLISVLCFCLAIEVAYAAIAFDNAAPGGYTGNQTSSRNATPETRSTCA